MTEALPNGEVASVVSRETEEALDTYWTTLCRWTRRINLVASSTIDDGWHRHVVDAVQLVPLLPSRSCRIVDLGSGGGLPAIPTALLRRRDYVDDVVMVEVDSRKAAFLRSACRSLGLRATVVPERAEGIPGLGADVITVRAMASLRDLLALAHRHLVPGGLLIAPKGRKAEAELEAARARWAFEFVGVPSVTSEDGRVLCLGAIHPREGARWTA